MACIQIQKEEQVEPSDFELHIYEDLIEGIGLCLKNRQNLSGLILIYSAIDTMAWLNRPPEQEDVSRKDFINWVDTYLLPGSELPCTATDLYAARCALLHSSSPESKMSRQGTAARLFYAWGNWDGTELQDHIARHGANAKTVHIAELMDAFLNAFERFLPVVQASPLMQSRMRNFLMEMRL